MDLSHSVERYWFLEAIAAGRQRVFPDGHAELVVNLGDCMQGQSDCLLIGQMKHCVDLVPTGTLRVFGVRLRPEAAMSIERLPIGEIAEFGGQRQWREQLGGAGSIEQMVEYTNLFQRRKLVEWAPDLRIREAVRLLAQWPRGIDSVASDVSTSRRQLERLFLQQVGLTPKTFARIARFQRALLLERDAPQWDWTRIAQECGCYDQAHLIAEFRQFTGGSPASRTATAMGDRLASR